jgi:hypothetical protein
MRLNNKNLTENQHYELCLDLDWVLYSQLYAVQPPATRGASFVKNELRLGNL